ncbi:MAG TPA: hypothetical protein VF100_13290, partial [Thermoanaerobaculia bacterium]
MKAVKRSCFQIPLLAILLTLAATAAAAQPRPAGPDLQLGDGGTWAAVALAADGGGALVWVAPDTGGVETVWTRPFAPDGTPLEPVTRVGEHRLDWDLSSRDRPVVAMAADGSWAVAWTAPRGAGTAVHVRRFDPLGRPAGPAVAASGSTADAAGPKLAVAPGGELAVAWTQAAGAESAADVWARRFAADGSPEGDAFRVNVATARRQEAGGVALATDGSLAVVFDTVRADTLQGDVLFALVAADGTPLVADRRVNAAAAGDQWESALAPLADGRWLVAFRSLPADADGGGGVVGRFVSVTGEPAGPELPLDGGRTGHQAEPAVAGLPDGGFVAVWSDRCNDFHRGPGAPDCQVPSNHRDGHFAGVYGRFFTADGRPAGGDFRVNGAATGHQFAPAVAAGPGGHVAASWTTNADRVWGSPTNAWWRPFGAASCSGDPRQLCLAGGRFVAEVEWTDFQGGRGRGTAVPRDDGWGYFWFFQPGNVELSVKLLDGRALNGHFWVFYGALSNVDYTLTVTDTETGAVRRYQNPAGRFASTGDTAAFPDPSGASVAAGAGVP